MEEGYPRPDTNFLRTGKIRASAQGHGGPFQPRKGPDAAPRSHTIPWGPHLWDPSRCGRRLAALRVRQVRIPSRSRPPELKIPCRQPPWQLPALLLAVNMTFAFCHQHDIGMSLLICKHNCVFNLLTEFLSRDPNRQQVSVYL